MLAFLLQFIINTCQFGLHLCVETIDTYLVYEWLCGYFYWWCYFSCNTATVLKASLKLRRLIKQTIVLHFDIFTLVKGLRQAYTSRWNGTSPTACKTKSLINCASPVTWKKHKQQHYNKNYLRLQLVMSTITNMTHMMIMKMFCIIFETFLSVFGLVKPGCLFSAVKYNILWWKSVNIISVSVYRILKNSQGCCSWLFKIVKGLSRVFSGNVNENFMVEWLSIVGTETFSLNALLMRVVCWVLSLLHSTKMFPDIEKIMNQ